MELILEFRTRENMAILAQHEPTDTQELRRNADIFSIFEAAGCTRFFQCLNGFHQETALRFALNITKTHLEDRGLHIEVIEEIVVEVTCLPQIGRA